MQSLVFLAAILIAAGPAAGCGSAGSTIKGAVSSLSSRSGTAPGPTTASAPVTSAPVTSAPVTSAPATATPTAAAGPTAAAAPAAAASTPAGSGSGTSLVWLWILLGALVVAGLIVWITRAARRGSAAAAAGWRSGLVDAYAKGSALYDAMNVAETPAAMAADDGGARWADIQRRADDLAQTLYSLREQVPHPEDRVRIADTLASLQAVRSAMDAERAPGGAGPRQAEVARNRLYAFESSLRALRSPGGNDVTSPEPGSHLT